MTAGAGPLPTVKEAHLAGRWYPAGAGELAASVREMLAAGGSPRPGVIAIVAPHAAYQYSGPTAASAFAAAGPSFGTRRGPRAEPFRALRGAALLR
jgi:AmmeMemoRadiSam system protein B